MRPLRCVNSSALPNNRRGPNRCLPKVATRSCQSKPRDEGCHRECHCLNRRLIHHPSTDSPLPNCWSVQRRTTGHYPDRPKAVDRLVRAMDCLRRRSAKHPHRRTAGRLLHRHRVGRFRCRRAECHRPGHRAERHLRRRRTSDHCQRRRQCSRHQNRRRSHHLGFHQTTNWFGRCQ